MNFSRRLREVHRGLSGGVPSADYHHFVVPAQLRFDVSGAVINALAFKLFQIVDGRLVVLRAAGNYDRARANGLAASTLNS